MQQSIEASAAIRVAFARARDVLVDDPGAVFSEAHTVDEARNRHFPMDIGLGLGAGATVHQDVVLKLGVPQSVDDGLVLPLEWHPIGHEHVLPTFTGQLEVSQTRPGTRLLLSGTYGVPLGVVGRIGDRVLGRRLARRSLATLVERFATRLESEVHARVDAAGWHPAPRRLDLSDPRHSEIYLG